MHVNVLCKKFNLDLNDSDALLAEIQLIKDDLHKSDADGIQEAAKFLLDKREFLPHLMKAYQVALTIPVSVAGNERSFSKLKIVKNYLRSTMKEERLDALMICACAINMLDNVDVETLADAWSKLKT